MTTHDVTFQRAEYSRALPRWQLVEDCCNGQDAVKAAGEKYLPRPNPLDSSPEAGARYKDYAFRAVFYNATGRTEQGLTGMAFRLVPSLEVPAALDYVTTDIDGAGLSIYQQSQLALGGVLRCGRFGLLADYPRTAGNTSLADMKAGGVRATLAVYAASAIINWRTEKVGGEHRLSLVVLAEQAEEVTPDGFGIACIEQYRVLRMLGGFYTVEIWRKNEKQEWVVFDAFTPLNSAGRPWSEIPFTFVGAKSNDGSVDDAPLYDLAELNIAHYRNSAEYEDTTFMCGQVQPVVTGMDEAWVKLLKEEGVKVGSRTLFPLPREADFKFVQAEPNVLPAEAMKHKEEQMIALGAQLVINDQQARTATEVDSNTTMNTSVLALCVSNVSEAYTKALNWLAQFMGAAESCVYAITQDFVEQKLDPQMLTALVGAWQSGTLPKGDLWNQYRKVGLIDPEKTDEQIDDEVEVQDDGLGLDDGNTSAVA